MSKKKGAAPADTFDDLLAQHTRMTAATQAAIEAPATATEQGQKPSELRFGDVGPSSGAIGALRLCASCKGPCHYRTRCPDCGDHLCEGECQMPTDVPRCEHCWSELPHAETSECPFSHWRDVEVRRRPHRDQGEGYSGRTASLGQVDRGERSSDPRSLCQGRVANGACPVLRTEF